MQLTHGSAHKGGAAGAGDGAGGVAVGHSAHLIRPGVAHLLQCGLAGDAAHLFTAGDGAGVIAGIDLGIVQTHDAACGGGGDGATVIAFLHRAGVIVRPAQDAARRASAGDNGGVAAGTDNGVVRGDAQDTARSRARDGAVVLTGGDADHRYAEVPSQNTACICLTRDRALIAAVGDGYGGIIALVHSAHDAARIVAGRGDVGLVDAVVNNRRAAGVGGDAAQSGIAGNGARHGQILDGAFQVGKESDIVEVHGNGVACAIKGAGEIADGAPLGAGQVDVRAQHSLGVGMAVADVLLEPHHFGGSVQRVCARFIIADHRYLGGSGSIVGGAGLGVGVRAHQIIGARLVKGISIRTVAGNVGQLVPVGVIDRHLQILDSLQRGGFAAHTGAGARLEGGGAQSLAHAHRIGVLGKLTEGTVAVEAPVAEQGHVQPVAVGQQHVVAGAAPALAHQRVLMIAEVHQVLVMAPESLHVQAGGVAGGSDRIAIATVIGLRAIHIQGVGFLVVVQNAGGALAALVGGQAHVVPLDQVDIGMESGGALDDRIVVVAAPAEFRAVTVVLAQTIVGQIKVGNGHVQIGQNGAICTQQRSTVVGQGNVDGHTVCGCLVVHRSNGGGKVGGKLLVCRGNGDLGGLTVGAGKLVARLVGHIAQLIPVGRSGGDCPNAGIVLIIIQSGSHRAICGIVACNNRSEQRFFGIGWYVIIDEFYLKIASQFAACNKANSRKFFSDSYLCVKTLKCAIRYSCDAAYLLVSDTIKSNGNKIAGCVSNCDLSDGANGEFCSRIIGKRPRIAALDTLRGGDDLDRLVPDVGSYIDLGFYGGFRVLNDGFLRLGGFLSCSRCVRRCIFIILLLRSGDVLHCRNVHFRGKGADRQQRDRHHQRHQQRDNSFLHLVIFLSLFDFFYIKRPCGLNF